MKDSQDKMKIINRDMMKYIAIIPMAIGHFIAYMEEYGLLTEITWWMTLLTSLSLLAPPIFFFFVAEGFRYTRSRKQYALRLLLFAAVTQIPFCVVNHGTLFTVSFFTLWNIIATLFLGLIALIVWESKLKMPVKIIIIVLLDAVTVLLSFEWMIFGIPIILGFHIFYDKPKARLIWFTALTLIFAFISSGFSLYVLFYENVFFMMISYFLITKCYNGKKGSHPVFAKWFFYIFYPLHLFLIYFTKLLIS